MVSIGLLAACGILEPPEATDLDPTAATVAATASVVAGTREAVAKLIEFEWQSNGGAEPLKAPVDLAVDQQSNVYVLDYSSSRILKLDLNGQLVAKWGSQGKGDGQFSFLYGLGGIAVDRQGNVYVADSGNARIEKFDSEGHFLSKWGSRGKGDGQFFDPFGIEV